MKIVTWNVNSVRARAARVAGFLERAAPDVLCLQETKVEDAAFPRELFAAAGYSIEIHGQKTYNGVALATRAGLVATDVVRGMPGDDDGAERRVIAASIGTIRVVDVYVVNGQEVGSEKYAKKLAWLSRLRDYLADVVSRHDRVVLCGDFNIAPDDRDVWDPEGLKGQLLVSDPERAALAAILQLGFEDLFRRFTAEGGRYSYWDYRQLAFPKNRGYRIDLVLGTKAAAARSRAVEIDRAERKGEGASDHAPVVAEFDD